MRFLYEPDEEELFERARDLLVEDFARARRRPGAGGAGGGGAGRPADDLAPFVAQCACDYRFQTGDGLLTLWSAALVRGFLLEFMVRKVTLALNDVPSVVPGLCAWFGYLEDTGQLDPRGPSAQRLVEFAQALAAQAQAAMRDPEQWGIAKFWMTAALERGVDLEDERALNRFLQSARDGRVGGIDEELVGRIAERHQERALFEQFGISASGRSREQSAQTGPRTMRQLPVVLASRGELAVAAARVALVRDMRVFVDWVGDSRRLTVDGKLRAADVRDAASVLRPDDADAPEPAVGLLSAWALAARLVKVRKGELSRVKSAAGTLRDDVKLWDRGFGAIAELAASCCRTIRSSGPG